MTLPSLSTHSESARPYDLLLDVVEDAWVLRALQCWHVLLHDYIDSYVLWAYFISMPANYARKAVFLAAYLFTATLKTALEGSSKPPSPSSASILSLG